MTGRRLAGVAAAEKAEGRAAIAAEATAALCRNWRRVLDTGSIIVNPFIFLGHRCVKLRDGRGFVASILDRLGHCFVYGEALDGLNLKMES